CWGLRLVRLRLLLRARDRPRQRPNEAIAAHSRWRESSWSFEQAGSPLARGRAAGVSLYLSCVGATLSLGARIIERNLFALSLGFVEAAAAINTPRYGGWRSTCRSTYCRRCSNARSRSSRADAHSRLPYGRRDTPSRRWRRSPPLRRKSDS